MLQLTLMAQLLQGLPKVSAVVIRLGLFQEDAWFLSLLKHSVAGAPRHWSGSEERLTPSQRAILRSQRRATGGKLLF